MRIGQKLSIPLSIISVGNLVNGLYRGEDFEYYLFYSIIFIPIIFLFWFVKKELKNEKISLILLILSMVGFWFNGDSSLAGTSLLTYSIYLSKNPKRIYLYSGVSLLLFIIRFTFTGQNPAQAATYLAGSSFLFVLYHHYIHPSKNADKKYTEHKTPYPSMVNSDVVDILQLRSKGFDWPEINDKLELNVTDQNLPRKVRDERNKHGFKTQDQFMFWLFENGIITSEKTECEKVANRRDKL